MINNTLRQLLGIDYYRTKKHLLRTALDLTASYFAIVEEHNNLRSANTIWIFSPIFSWNAVYDSQSSWSNGSSMETNLQKSSSSSVDGLNRAPNPGRRTEVEVQENRS